MMQELSRQLKENGSLEKLLNQYLAMSMTPILGYELEFCLPEDDVSQIQVLLPMPLEKERGKNQYEISTTPFTNIAQMIDSIYQTRQLLEEKGANFHPKPFADDYGNAMHFHLNIKGLDGTNLLDDKMTLQFAANGVCKYINETIFAVLTKEEDYLRLDERFMAPTHICYGNNNRTAAIRVPQQKPTRIEYRIPSALSDPHVTVFVLLKSSLAGLQGKWQDHGQVFGNAFDPHYNLQPIAKSLQEAKKLFNPDFFQEE